MKITLLIIAFVCSLIAPAQTVHVYFSKGEVVVKSGETMTKVSTATKLIAGDILQLKTGATVVLWQGNKALVLKGENERTFSDIQKEIEGSKRSVTDRYISYLWQKAQQERSQNDDEGKGKMNVTGMVTRGTGSILLPADSSLIIGNAFILSVEMEMIPGFLIFYKKKKPLFSISINQEQIILENLEMIAKDEWYGLEVKNDKAAPMGQIIYVKWANDGEKEAAQTEMRNLLMALSDYPKEVQKEMIVAYYAVNRYVNLQSQ